MHVLRNAIEHPGLSPRVRGNPRPRHVDTATDGSIPAGAGEPPPVVISPGLDTVYPRGCGGTEHPGMSVLAPVGLSPRVRGNRHPGEVSAGSAWSIPAGAGEPPTLRLPTGTPRVYPRGCGGTVRTPSDANSRKGLSPRVRGNRSDRHDRHLDPGSIPAGAGEPHEQHFNPTNRTVYPRGCGGTQSSIAMSWSLSGLSPRVRGNLGLEDRRAVVAGSIPAGAGEPRQPASP